MAIGDIVQELAADLHSLVDLTTIRRKVLEAARDMRTKRLWFSERTFEFTLIAGREVYRAGDGYGLPADFKEVVGDVLWVKEGGSEITRKQVYRAQDNQYLSLKASPLNASSYPSYFNLRGGLLYLWPLETRTTDILVGNYVKSLEIPTSHYDVATAGFVFRTDGGALLTEAELDLFESDWFEQGRAADAVKQRAQYLLYKDVLKDQEGAQDALTGWLEKTATLEEDSEQRQGGGLEVLGYLL